MHYSGYSVATNMAAFYSKVRLDRSQYLYMRCDGRKDAHHTSCTVHQSLRLHVQHGQVSHNQFSVHSEIHDPLVGLTCTRSECRPVLNTARRIIAVKPVWCTPVSRRCKQVSMKRPLRNRSCAVSAGRRGNAVSPQRRPPSRLTKCQGINLGVIRWPLRSVLLLQKSAHAAIACPRLQPASVKIYHEWFVWGERLEHTTPNTGRAALTKGFPKV